MRNLVRKMQRFVKLHGGTRMFLETIVIRSRLRVPRYGHESSIKPKMNSHQVRGRLIFPVGYCFLWLIGWTSRQEIKKKKKGTERKSAVHRQFDTPSIHFWIKANTRTYCSRKSRSSTAADNNEPRRFFSATSIFSRASAFALTFR